MNKRSPWLWIALLLFIAAGVIAPSIRPGRASTDQVADEPRFPRYPSAEQYELMQKRRTMDPLPAPADQAEPNTVRRDPLLVALPPSKGFLVFELKAFMDSPVGRMLMACLAEQNDLPTLEDEGFDPKLFDRMAVANLGDGRDGIAVMSGDFSDGRLAPALEDRTQRSYGEHAVIYGPSESRAGAPHAYAVWNNQLALLGDSEDALIAAIDRLEGRRNEPSWFNSEEAYGDIYGRLPAETAAELLPFNMRDRMADSELDVGLHVDTAQDVLIAVDGYGGDEHTKDIGKMLGALLGAQRFQAAVDGDDKLSELLDLFEVNLYDEGFQLNAAFTREFVARRLGECATRARRDIADDPPQAGTGG